MINSPAFMHIPDGYLSPVTSLILFLLVLPFWYRGIRKLRGRMNARNVPLIALMAAFSFVVMMFNVPLPGGTTGHAVAGAIAAIILGPEIATIAISIALVIQALFFGDGGILQIGANSFNMAVILPFISYAVYRLFAADSAVMSRRRVVGAALGGWLGLTVAAFFAAVEFGLQPIFWHTADGTPLYAPYLPGLAIPAMVIPHALVASVIEGVITALVVVYLQRTNPVVLSTSTGRSAPQTGRRPSTVTWVALAILAVATPLGLLAPGTAWGEWGAEQLARGGLGFVPAGLAQLSHIWTAPLASYNMPLLGNATLGYVLSAVVGVLLVATIAWLLTRLFTGSDKQSDKT
ncbi:MAG TPA: cobalt transporter CbiM [Anaerolineae bacterium]